MQRTSKHLSVFAIVACVVAVLAFGGTAAFAAGNWWNPPEGGNTLTVNATGNEDLKNDIANGDVNLVLDVIKVADATADATFETFSYKLVGQFATSGEGKSLQELIDNPSTENWKKLADALEGMATLTEKGNAIVQEDGLAEIGGLEDGLYLVLAHGKGKTDASVAYSSTYEYTFDPVLIAVPSKEADESGVIRTDSPGEWQSSVSANLKPQQGPLYGSLRIVKHIDGFEGEPASFVFRIQSVDDLGNPDGKYDNYASVYYSSGESAETTVTHIKAGTNVLVTEEYEGARFKYVSGNGIVGPIVADAWLKSDENRAMLQIDFTNEPTNITTGGHGIQNTTTMIPKGNTDSWNGWTWSDWVGSPAEEVIDPPNGDE